MSQNEMRRLINLVEDANTSSDSNKPTEEWNQKKGQSEWRLPNGVLHREDGPAIEVFAGPKRWYLNGKLSRPDGPAIIYRNGDTAWYKDGKLHREDGPAEEFTGGRKLHYLNGIYVPAAQFDQCKKKLGLT